MTGFVLDTASPLVDAGAKLDLSFGVFDQSTVPLNP